MGFFSFRDGALFVHHTLDEHPSSGDFSMHAHECYELFYFDKGSAVFWVEGTPYPLLPGDMMLFNVSEAHKIELQSDAPYERMGDVPNVVFPCAALTDADTGRIAIYYGCADTVTGLAFTTVEELVQYTKTHSC